MNNDRYDNVKKDENHNIYENETDEALRIVAAAQNAKKVERDILAYQESRSRSVGKGKRTSKKNKYPIGKTILAGVLAGTLLITAKIAMDSSTQIDSQTKMKNNYRKAMTNTFVVHGFAEKKDGKVVLKDNTSDEYADVFTDDSPEVVYIIRDTLNNMEIADGVTASSELDEIMIGMGYTGFTAYNSSDIAGTYLNVNGYYNQKISQADGHNVPDVEVFNNMVGPKVYNEDNQEEILNAINSLGSETKGVTK